MALTISVGEPAQALRANGHDVFREPIEAINVILARAGLSAHAEPYDIPDSAVFSTGYSYGVGIVQMRLAAHLALYGSPPPPFDWRRPPDAHDAAYRVFEELSKDWRDATIEALLSPRPLPREPRFNQLISPSTYFVPQDCSPLPVLYGEDDLDGGSVGSTIRLLAECEEILNHFDFPADLDPDDEPAWVAETGPWRAYETEIICTLRLAKACRASIDHKALMIFD